jgi:hypothetical protein
LACIGLVWPLHLTLLLPRVPLLLAFLLTLLPLLLPFFTSRRALILLSERRGNGQRNAN